MDKKTIIIVHEIMSIFFLKLIDLINNKNKLNPKIALIPLDLSQLIILP